MIPKNMAAALLLGALLLAPAYGGGQHGDVSEERTCQFKLQVEPILEVSPCVEFKEKLAFLLVRTNSRTLVCIESTEFKRNERDCDGNLLDTVDTIPSKVRTFFLETPHCVEGAELEVKELPDDCWCVNPHRGGYAIVFLVNPDGADICDDAGCYVAEVKVTITAEPFEDCEKGDGGGGGGGGGKAKGNNGVGNGLDPQPPGDPPINDGPGTSPGDPGNRGGAQN